MTTTLPDDPASQAVQLLDQLFRAGARHLYIFGRMKAEAATRAALTGGPRVVAEELRILMALIAETAGAPAKSVHQQGAKKARELIPGLEGWEEPGSDWLGSGVERLPLSLVPLLLRRKVAWDDRRLAQVLSGCRVSKGGRLLDYHRPVIQSLIAHVDREFRTQAVGEATRVELTRLRRQLAGYAAGHISSLATWARKQAVRIETILRREEVRLARAELRASKA